MLSFFFGEKSSSRAARSIDDFFFSANRGISFSSIDFKTALAICPPGSSPREDLIERRELTFRGTSCRRRRLIETVIDSYYSIIRAAECHSSKNPISFLIFLNGLHPYRGRGESYPSSLIRAEIDKFQAIFIRLICDLFKFFPEFDSERSI